MLQLMAFLQAAHPICDARVFKFRGSEGLISLLLSISISIFKNISPYILVPILFLRPPSCRYNGMCWKCFFPALQRANCMKICAQSGVRPVLQWEEPVAMSRISHEFILYFWLWTGCFVKGEQWDIARRERDLPAATPRGQQRSWLGSKDCSI